MLYYSYLSSNVSCAGGIRHVFVTFLVRQYFQPGLTVLITKYHQNISKGIKVIECTRGVELIFFLLNHDICCGKSNCRGTVAMFKFMDKKRITILHKKKFFLDLWFVISLVKYMDIFTFQDIIKLVVGRLAAGDRYFGKCYALKLVHTKSRESYWLHNNLTMYQVKQKYEASKPPDEWR